MNFLIFMILECEKSKLISPHRKIDRCHILYGTLYTIPHSFPQLGVSISLGIYVIGDRKSKFSIQFCFFEVTKKCTKFYMGIVFRDKPISATNWSREDFSTTAPTYFFTENTLLNALEAFGHSIDRFGWVKVIKNRMEFRKVAIKFINIQRKLIKFSENQ